MVADPAATPVTTPVDAFTVAMEVLLLDHVPYTDVPRRIVSKAQAAPEPEMTGGGSTVIIVPELQPATV